MKYLIKILPTTSFSSFNFTVHTFGAGLNCHATSSGLVHSLKKKDKDNLMTLTDTVTTVLCYYPGASLDSKIKILYILPCFKYYGHESSGMQQPTSCQVLWANILISSVLGKAKGGALCILICGCHHTKVATLCRTTPNVNNNRVKYSTSLMTKYNVLVMHLDISLVKFYISLYENSNWTDNTVLWHCTIHLIKLSMM